MIQNTQNKKSVSSNNPSQSVIQTKDATKATFPKYPAYKDSGVECLGEIPEGWNNNKLKHLCSIFNGDSLNESKKKKYSSENPADRPYISSKDINVNDASVNYENGLRIPIENTDLKIAKKNSVLLCIEGGSAGKKIAFTNQSVCFVNKLACFEGYLDRVNKKYLFYSLKANPFKTQFNLSMSGLIGGVAISVIKNIYIPTPSLPEQTAIANFLDDKTAKIDRIIAQKEKMIELLKERKQIIIQNAVTGKLKMDNGQWIMRPKSEMKDSGVEWIGEIPEHWEVKKLKFLLRIKNGQEYKHVISEEGFPVIGSGGAFAFAKQYLYDGEALLLGRKGTIDKPLYVNEKFWTVDTMFYAIVKNEYSTRFLYFVALTIPFKLYSTSTALPSMTQDDLNNHKVAVPNLKEQITILNYLDVELGKIDKSIALQQTQIEKLKEYKATLIDSAVTGKIKVTDYAI